MIHILNRLKVLRHSGLSTTWRPITFSSGLAGSVWLRIIPNSLSVCDPHIIHSRSIL